MAYKEALFNAEACYRFSLELHQEEEISNEIAYLEIGRDVLAEALKAYPTGVPDEIVDAINKLQTHIKLNLQNAMKINQVYQMRALPASSLQPLPEFAKKVARALNICELLGDTKNKLFANLIPNPNPNTEKKTNTKTKMKTWVPPLGKKIKINCDAACIQEAGRSAIGIVMRHFGGDWKIGLVKCFLERNNNVAECRAVNCALNMVRLGRYLDASIESDNETVIRWINSQGSVSARCKQMIQDFRRAEKVDGLEFNHVLREANRVADKVAKLALDSNTKEQVLLYIPKNAELENLLNFDMQAHLLPETTESQEQAAKQAAKECQFIFHILPKLGLDD